MLMINRLQPRPGSKWRLQRVGLMALAVLWTAEEFNELLRGDAARYLKVARAANVKVE